MGTIPRLLLEGTIDTLIMVGVALSVAYILGIPLGIWLVITRKDGLTPRPWLNRILGRMVNLLRSLPFIIFLTLLIPFTRFLVGTSIGLWGTIVPLAIAAAPFVARLVEQSLLEISPQLIDAMIVSGATPWQIVIRVYLVEAFPSLIRGIGIAGIALIGYSAMAGATGGGGLGDIAIRYGYYNYRMDVMLYTVAILIIIVEGFQTGIHWIAKKVDKKI
jgi:D-methionine transport system permease protein